MNGLGVVEHDQCAPVDKLRSRDVAHLFEASVGPDEIYYLKIAQQRSDSVGRVAGTQIDPIAPAGEEMREAVSRFERQRALADSGHALQADETDDAIGAQLLFDPGKMFYSADERFRRRQCRGPGVARRGFVRRGCDGLRRNGWPRHLFYQNVYLFRDLRQIEVDLRFGDFIVFSQPHGPPVHRTQIQLFQPFNRFPVAWLDDDRVEPQLPGAMLLDQAWDFLFQDEVRSEGIGGDQQNADASRFNGVSDSFEPILAALDAAIIP